MVMKYWQTFTVTGSGYFPLDMLRYDRCYPMGQEDVSEMQDAHALRAVNISRYVALKTDAPTSARWLSFGWSVTDVMTTKTY